MQRSTRTTIVRICQAMIVAALLVVSFCTSTFAASTSSSVEARPTIRPTRAAPPRPTPAPAPASDPTAALSACASDIFGLSMNYTQSGGLSSTVLRSLSIPTPSKGTISLSLDPGATAIYGLTSEGGVQTLIYGSGAASSGSASVTVSAASLCYLQRPSSQATPTSADAALALLKASFPGVPQRAPYVSKSTQNGYLFVLPTKHAIPGSSETSAQVIVLSAQSTSNGLLLSAMSGTGSYAAVVSSSVAQ